jgi:hypothetical protein
VREAVGELCRLWKDDQPRYADFATCGDAQLQLYATFRVERHKATIDCEGNISSMRQSYVKAVSPRDPLVAFFAEHCRDIVAEALTNDDVDKWNNHSQGDFVEALLYYTFKMERTRLHRGIVEDLLRRGDRTFVSPDPPQ